MLLTLNRKHFAVLMIVILMTVLSSIAFAADPAGAPNVNGMLQAIIDFLSGTTGKLVAIIALMLIGLAALFGLFDKRAAGFWALGIILIFSAPWIVDQIA